MKTLRTILFIIAALVFSAEQSKASATTPAPGTVTFQLFYDELSPYGSWVSYGSYGYVWIPAMGAGFIPYSTNGHWVYTDYGWMWASSYNWGWAPFHYGRWLYDDFYGWIWVPGYDWAPAWVVWGYYDDYYGWAPIAPGITVIAGYRPPAHYWMYCPARYVTHVHVHRYVVRRGIPNDRVNIVDNYSPNRNYHYGPRREGVEKATGRQVQRVAVVEKKAPAAARVSGGRVEVFRPEISKGNATPARVKKLEEVKPANKSLQKGDTGDPVYEKSTYEKREKATQPQRKTMPEKKSAEPQNRSGDGKREKITPQQRQEPQQRIEPRQKEITKPKNSPRERVEPRQKMNPREEKPAPQMNPQNAPAEQERQKVAPPRREDAPQQMNPPRQNPPRQKMHPRQAPQQHRTPPGEGRKQPHQKPKN